MNLNRQGEIDFQTVLDCLLGEEGTIPERYLLQFSDIIPKDLQSLLEAWPRIDLSRKLLLLDQLNALADVNTLVSFDELGRALLEDEEAPVRQRAVRLLVECDDERLIPRYIEMLISDAENAVRAEVASTLGLFVQLGEFDEISEESKQQVEETLLDVTTADEEEPNIRRRALEALGFSSRREVPTLIQSAFEREDPDWRASALFAMGRTSDERWQAQVLQMIAAENRRTRFAAVKSAGELGLKAAGPLLLNLLEEEFDEAIAGAAIWSLSQIGGEDARLYLENLLDNMDEDEPQYRYVEEALDNLAFTDDLAQFDLMSYDPDEDLNLAE
ncbi:MAG: HEAT repeat domain-containing protein [Anaerolineales bacterium]